LSFWGKILKLQYEAKTHCRSASIARPLCGGVFYCIELQQIRVEQGIHATFQKFYMYRVSRFLGAPRKCVIHNNFVHAHTFIIALYHSTDVIDTATSIWLVQPSPFMKIDSIISNGDWHIKFIFHKRKYRFTISSKNFEVYEP
jgi:hypothetical protein